MKKTLVLAIASLVLTSCSSSNTLQSTLPDPSSATKTENTTSRGLPAFSWGTPGSYKVDHFIVAADMLQSLGKDKAVTMLRNAMINRSASDDTIIILCRLLFTAKPGGEFRTPSIGTAIVLGGRDNFPLEPIEVVNGIPFLVVSGYIQPEVPEPADTYLNYCLSDCVWGAFKYKLMAVPEKTTALEKLNWKTPLSSSEMGFVASQLE